MNRELRRLQAKEDERARDKRKQVQKRKKKDRVGFRQFFSEVRTELKRVAWPNRREVITFTTVTLITAGFVTLYTFGLDVLFKESILQILELR
ncbi:preprotein translocase subunit SecE [bacterium]|nr:preprotein translocase subunit SecE [bacterium]